ncbi:MAG: SDR family oxidoreductase [Sphingomonas sp.]|jgi:NAD(P)-dependent dehydrogenase (short-subunit alcohol dehydrogenase family)
MSALGSFAGRHALVTGGGTGIGAAVARRLSLEGVAVSLVGRRAGPLETLAAALPKAVAIPGDICAGDEVAQMLAQARRAFGPVDILVNNAGAAQSGPFEELDLAGWRRMMEVNLDGLFTVTQAALPDLRAAAAGRVITIASTAGVKGYAYSVPYCAAKHGAIGFTRALAAELACTAVTVNAVCPGFTDTAIVAEAAARIAAKTGRSAEDARGALARFNPQGRLITPEEVAETVLWLSRPDSGSITGQAIMVAGGEVG